MNPSYEIAKLLPKSLPATAQYPTEVHILVYPDAVPVRYKEVRELVPAILDSYAEHVDLVMHIGMAPGHKYYAAERIGHRDGYDKNKDLDGVTLPSDDGEKRFPGCGKSLSTSLDYDEVMRNWQRNIAAQSDFRSIDARESDDAGHYLCDYIYFNSLAWYSRRVGKTIDGKVTDRPVLFFHVPGESDENALKQGVVAAEALIRAMSESWSISGRYEKDLPDR